jgi:Ca-activated chloride channel homolog
VVESEERLDEVMDQVHGLIGTAVLTNLRLEPAGLTFVPGSIVPSRLPDLFAGSPLMLMGRYTGSPEGAIALQARDAAGKMWQAEVKASRATSAAPATVWARGRLREMEDSYAVANDPALAKEIVAVSLRFGVLCRFTAFVAVDRASVVNPGGQIHSIVQPVEQPEGWEMAGTMVACAAAMPMQFMVGSVESCDATTDYDALETMGSFAGKRSKRKPRKFGKLAVPAPTKSPAPVAPISSPLMSTPELLQFLSTAGANTESRLDTLRIIAQAFENIVEEAKATDAEAPITTRLNDCGLMLRLLLAELQPSDADVNAVWNEVVAALTEYQAATNAEPPPRREEFWA